MQRALSSRTSVLSAAAKRAPFARSTLNLQQQRFAHKVGGFGSLQREGSVSHKLWAVISAHSEKSPC